MTRLTRRGFLALLGFTAAGACVAVGDPGGALRLWNQVVVGRVRIQAQLLGPGGALVGDGRASHRVRVQNQGVRCWVRGRTLLGERDRWVSVSQAADDLWATAPDGWRYLKLPLEKNAAVLWTETVSEPVRWQGGEARTMEARTRFQAVQADHVEQDLASGTPWGSVEGTACAEASGAGEAAREGEALGEGAQVGEGAPRGEGLASGAREASEEKETP